MLFFIFFLPVFSAQANPENTNQLIEYLIQEKINLTLAINDAKQVIPPNNSVEYRKRVQENKALLSLLNVKLANLESLSIQQKKLQKDYTIRIKKLQQTPVIEAIQLSAEDRIEKISTLSEVNRKTLELIEDNLTLAKNYNQLLLKQQQDLDVWRSKESMQDDIEKLKDQENKLSETLSMLYEKSIKLQQDIKANAGSKDSFPGAYGLEIRLLLNNQLVILTQYQITEINLQKRLIKADYMLLKNPDLKSLQRVTEIYEYAIQQLAEMRQALNKMIDMLKNEQIYVGDNQLKSQFSSLLGTVKTRIDAIHLQEKSLQDDLENHKIQLKKQLSLKQRLLEYKLDTFPIFVRQFAQIPTQFYQYIKSLSLKVKENYLWQDIVPSIFIWVTIGLITIATLALSKFLNKISYDKSRSRLSGHLYDGILLLLNRNIPHLTLLTIMVLVFYLNHIPFSNYQLLLNLIAIWLIFRILVHIARLALLERVSDESGKDVRLYYRIKWLLVAGGWTMGLMMFSHQLPLSLLLQDIFNRFFMLFLLAVAVVAWKSKETIIHVLDPIIQLKKTYIRNAVILLVILLPLTILTTAIIGLVGYINLAWILSKYQVEILLVITTYILGRGLIFDALELLSEWMISSLQNGWLWIEVLLKPLDKLFQVLLMGSCAYFLFWLFGWASDSRMLNGLLKFGEYPLVNVSGIYITPANIVKFLIVLSVSIWVARWTREFCYRWLYRHTKDPGIRNSLAVFTQYAVILIAGFLNLHILGLEFSGMSMIIGGLAVGMGFGLRDFASNIVGGLMLLIERPVREGDLISLGNYEGKVAHIGIRSMRVSSWDNMEVLIPNAETFNKPFTNWTHQDGIVRTVIPIKVNRSDDPLMIQQLIMDVLAIIPEIVADPPPQVLLKQIDEVLLEFEVRYFINVQVYTRFEVRSKVLFAILSQFKAAGIHAPIPPIHVELKEKDSHDVLGSNHMTKKTSSVE